MRPAQRFSTGIFLTKPDNSAIRDPYFNFDLPFKMSNFYIIDTAEKLLDVRISESIHIINNRLEINNNQT